MTRENLLKIILEKEAQRVSEARKREALLKSEIKSIRKEGSLISNLFSERVSQHAEFVVPKEDGFKEVAPLNKRGEVSPHRGRKRPHAPKPIFEKCFWKECENPPVGNSKYCSRACCVRNSRELERLRRKSKKSET